MIPPDIQDKLDRIIRVDSDSVPDDPARADAIIRYVRGRGSDASDIRDATHEAHHALVAGCRNWDREAIHKALTKHVRKTWGRGMAYRIAIVREEFHARAVEWIVCERFGLAYDLDKWAHAVFFETHANMRIMLPSDDTIAKAITACKSRPSVIRAAERVLALGETK